MSRKSKTCIAVLSLWLATFAGTAVFGQVPAGEPKAGGAAAKPARTAAIIGIVDIQDAIIATNEGKKEFDALQARFGPKQKDLKALADEIEKLKNDLQAKGDKLNQEERAKQAKILETRQKTLQRNYEDAQNEFQQSKQEVFNRIGGKMLSVLEKYAKNNDYTIILDVSNTNTPVLWASQGTNITKELVDAYNAESPVAAAPVAPVPRPSGAAANRTPAGSTTTPKKP